MPEELTPEMFLAEVEEITKRCYALRDRAIAELPTCLEMAVCMGALGAVLSILEQLISLGAPEALLDKAELLARFEDGER